MNAIYDIPKVTHLTVGDPMYLEDIENGRVRGCERESIFDGKLKPCRVSRLKITAVDYDQVEVEEKQAKEYKVDIAGASDEGFVNCYLSDITYPQLEKITRGLGCDTASFFIEVNNDRSDTVHTGADGYYGTIIKYKEPYGFHLILFFDADLFTFRDIEREMAYLFNFKVKEPDNEKKEPEESEK